MKWNWGFGIAALYLGFVAMMVGLVVMSMGRKVDLVTEQYYEEELKFSDKMVKMKRSQTLPDQLDWKVSDTSIVIDMPENIANISGKVIFYCPANSENDKIFNINNGENPIIIPVAMLAKGRYKMQIDWSSEGIDYWNEGVVVIN
jgi:hypothetical protein